MMTVPLRATILGFSGHLQKYNKILTTCRKVKTKTVLNTQDITLQGIYHNIKNIVIHITFI